MEEVKTYYNNKNLRKQYFINENNKIHGLYQVYYEDSILMNESYFLKME